MTDSDDRPHLLCLAFLGGTAREWDWVAARLSPAFHVVGIDLPGFGSAADVPGYAVADMVEHVVAARRRLGATRWVLAGHSMGAKVAAGVALRAEAGEAGLEGLEQLVLLAGSPPGPEPMDEAQRTTMRGWFAADPATSRTQAETYVGQNVGAPLPEAMQDTVVAGVLQTNRAAWLAWLDSGSREDWRDRVGVLRTPAVILAGAEDEALGPDAQRRLMAPHFATSRLIVLEGAGHLLPLERADAVAQAVLGGMPAEYRAFIDSARVSTPTRAALLQRALPDDADYAPRALSPAALATLRALVDHVLPQPEPAIDLAARIDSALADGPGDGWRPATLPPDIEAYGLALQTLAAGGFDGASHRRREAILQAVAAGDGGAAGLLTGPQMKLWFEEIRAEAARHYVAHPAALARIGYGGIGIGGDAPPPTGPRPGFVTIGAGEREPWEPLAPGEAA